MHGHVSSFQNLTNLNFLDSYNVNLHGNLENLNFPMAVFIDLSENSLTGSLNPITEWNQIV